MPDLSSLKLINEYMYHFFINLNKYMKGFNFYYMHVYVQSYNVNIIIKKLLIYYIYLCVDVPGMV